MIKSMTGFGRARVAHGSKKITVEVRTLNSKQLDMNVKLPVAFRPVEHELRSKASAVIGRGKADIYVMAEDASAAGGTRINTTLFAAYYRQLMEAAKVAKMPMAGFGYDPAAIMAAILRMPEVMISEFPDAPEEEDRALMNAADEALAALDRFRAEEGGMLMSDMLARVATIMDLLARIEPFEKARIGTVKARILENVAAVGVAVDGNRLEQEMVFWVEKLDITEEKVRLAKHCDYFREVAGSDEEGVGRKLGFVAQEMGREINTLGSKANDAGIQRIVVQMKDELEKIKEQLLNIL